MNYSSPTQLAPLTLASLPQVSEACISLVSIMLSSHMEDLHGFNYFSTARTEKPQSAEKVSILCSNAEKLR